jgi:hypothetical protein
MPPHKTHYHEASHLVFNALMQNLCIDYPKPSYVEIKDDDTGGIDGGWFTIYDANAVDEPYKKALDNNNKRIIEFFHLLVGYTSSRVFFNSERQFEFKPNYPSDFFKCNKIASLITNNSSTPSMELNNVNLKLFESIEQDVIDILKIPIVKDTVEYIAKEIADKADKNGKTKIDGQDFIDLFDEACKRVKDISIQPYIDKHVQRTNILTLLNSNKPFYHVTDVKNQTIIDIEGLKQEKDKNHSYNIDFLDIYNIMLTDESCLNLKNILIKNNHKQVCLCTSKSLKYWKKNFISQSKTQQCVVYEIDINQLDISKIGIDITFNESENILFELAKQNNILPHHKILELVIKETGVIAYFGDIPPSFLINPTLYSL